MLSVCQLLRVRDAYLYPEHLPIECCERIRSLRPTNLRFNGNVIDRRCEPGWDSHLMWPVHGLDEHFFCRAMQSAFAIAGGIGPMGEMPDAYVPLPSDHGLATGGAEAVAGAPALDFANMHHCALVVLGPAEITCGVSFHGTNLIL